MNSDETEHVLAALMLVQLAMQDREVELGQMIHSDEDIAKTCAAIAGVAASVMRLLPQQTAIDTLDAWRQAALTDEQGDDAR